MIRCWRCQKPVPYRASALCSDCHIVEMERVHAHDTPDAPEFEIVGEYQPPLERASRPHSSGRRVIRKSEPMAG